MTWLSSKQVANPKTFLKNYDIKINKWGIKIYPMVMKKTNNLTNIGIHLTNLL